MTQLVAGEYDALLNGIRIHYTIRGSGPPLIAHSGGPGFDARGWDDFAKIYEFVTIISIHPRGSGLSDPPQDDAYLLSDYAADIDALRIHLSLDKPIVLGWSHGGMVAQQFAFSYPDSLSGLILYETSAYLGESFGDIEVALKVFKDQPWYEKSFKAFMDNAETDEEMTRLWEDQMKFYFKLFDNRIEAYHSRTKNFTIRISPMIFFGEHVSKKMDLRPRLKEITVPTLVIVGRHDFITNVTMAEEMMKDIQHSHLEIFEDSGHFAFVEEPEKFYRVIKQFVSRL